MAGGSITFKVRITGLRETIAAFRDLPPEASKELREGSRKLADSIAPRIAAAARSRGSQAAAVASTVKSRRDRVPVIVAGGSKRVTQNRASAGDLVIASEFGSAARYGWYSKPRYSGSSGRQYPPRNGNVGYWFFPTAEAAQPEIDHEWNAMAGRIIEKWAS
jgi:D-serine deaminase-like pyridoxal phosphate-dependent protein